MTEEQPKKGTDEDYISVFYGGGVKIMMAADNLNWIAKDIEFLNGFPRDRSPTAADLKRYLEGVAKLLEAVEEMKQEAIGIGVKFPSSEHWSEVPGFVQEMCRKANQGK